jgi:hypothetical protein
MYIQRVVSKRFPTIPTNIIHTCHVAFHVDFSSIKDVMGCGPKLPHVNLKSRGA